MNEVLMIDIRNNKAHLDDGDVRSLLHNYLMQRTGLQDKNWVDIYESDIVLMRRNGEGVEKIREVEYDPWVSWYWAGDDYLANQKFKYDTFEVIGNVYENPELFGN